MFIVRPWRYLWRYKKGEGYSLVRMFVTFFSNCLHDIIDTINVWGMYIYICFCMLMCCSFPYLLFASLPSAIAFLHVFLKHIRRFRDFTLIALRESYLFSSYCIYSFLLFFLSFFSYFFDTSLLIPRYDFTCFTSLLCGFIRIRKTLHTWCIIDTKLDVLD